MHQHSDADLVRVENFSRVGDGKPFGISEPQGLVLIGRKLLGQFPNRSSLVLLLQQNRWILKIHFLVRRQLPEPPAGAKMIVGGAFGDRKQPGAESLSTIEAMDVLINFNERFLR